MVISRFKGKGIISGGFKFAIDKDRSASWRGIENHDTGWFKTFIFQVKAIALSKGNR